jgi:hypothetical protein
MTDTRPSILFLLCSTAQGRLRRRGRRSRPSHGAGREGERPGLGRRGRVGGRVDVGGGGSGDGSTFVYRRHNVRMDRRFSQDSVSVPQRVAVWSVGYGDDLGSHYDLSRFFPCQGPAHSSVGASSNLIKLDFTLRKLLLRLVRDSTLADYPEFGC